MWVPRKETGQHTRDMGSGEAAAGSFENLALVPRHFQVHAACSEFDQVLSKVSLWRYVAAEKKIVAIGFSHIDHDCRREVARPFSATEVSVVASGNDVNSIAVTQIDPRLEMSNCPKVCFA